ncbi:MAG: 3-deoxy-manno-octulosonate cytidylyltransferase [Kordiimonadaceae bacterium]|jgi:3-deoxy-manno-octulosonate cytidylyltransferase (CMP-KDO synthetase)|nr:3-deoxy-manno-octulosonate cytidylyltransferase [Kordiimonadaceae bacterium]
MSFKLLDCTLRDGGYWTEWEFSREMVRDTVKSLIGSGIDVVELGYKSPLKGGKWRKTNDGFVSSVVGDLCENVELSFMLDLKEFSDADGNVVESRVLECVRYSSESPFSICRIAIKPSPSEAKRAAALVEIIRKLGYKCMVNIMQCHLLAHNRDLRDSIVSSLQVLDIEALYFADSFGSCLPEMVETLVESVTECSVGAHFHDNMGLAFANSLAAINSGCKYVDSTVTGMGRGVGNTKTEQMLTLCEFQYEGSGRHNGLQGVISKHFSNGKWGYSESYLISGAMKIHPTYVQRLQEEGYSPSQIQTILTNLSITDSFDYDAMQKAIKDSRLAPRVACIIPARYKSSRFPGKPLVDISGKPMIIRVADIAAEAMGGKEDVYIATENMEIQRVVEEYGYRCIMTSDTCLTGTDRVAEAALEIDADYFINIQGDEPMLNPEDVKRVISAKLSNRDSVINCVADMSCDENPEDPSVPKMVVAENGSLLYASRVAIPGTKDGSAVKSKKQVCIYGFSKEELERFSSVQVKGYNEWAEDIEIIRFLELGINVICIEVDGDTIAVDYPEDAIAVSNRLDAQ